MYCAQLVIGAVGATKTHILRHPAALIAQGGGCRATPHRIRLGAVKRVGERHSITRILLGTGSENASAHRFIGSTARPSASHRVIGRQFATAAIAAEACLRPVMPLE